MNPFDLRKAIFDAKPKGAKVEYTILDDTEEGINLSDDETAKKFMDAVKKHIEGASIL